MIIVRDDDICINIHRTLGSYVNARRDIEYWPMGTEEVLRMKDSKGIFDVCCCHVDFGKNAEFSEVLKKEVKSTGVDLYVVGDFNASAQPKVVGLGDHVIQCYTDKMFSFYSKNPKPSHCKSFMRTIDPKVPGCENGCADLMIDRIDHIMKVSAAESSQ